MPTLDVKPHGLQLRSQVSADGQLELSLASVPTPQPRAEEVLVRMVGNFLQKAGSETSERLRQRVASELKTTFASRYAGELSLHEALQPEAIALYARHATGNKYLITPAR